MDEARIAGDQVKDIVVVGAGPAGLSAAIAAKKMGLGCTVFERGAVVNSILHFPVNMGFFTTPELLELGGLPFVTPYEKPTRDEALRYYRRVVDAYELDVQLGWDVRGITRESGRDGEGCLAVETYEPQVGESRCLARAVVVAVGAYERPNLLGVPGEDLAHVSHYYTEAHPYYRKRVVVVGGKNSAAEAALELFRAGVDVTLVHRHAELGSGIKYWVRPDIENRIKEGSIPALFETRVVEIHPRAVVVEREGKRWELPADGVFLLTGYHPDVEMLSRFGIAVDPETMVPSHAPETYETNVPNLFLAGQVISGIHSGQIFIENGRFHGEMVVKEIARRQASNNKASVSV